MPHRRRKMVRRSSPSCCFDRSAPVSAGQGRSVMEKLVNFRDFGDVTAGEGGRVAAGRLFRSGPVGSLGTPPLERLVRKSGREGRSVSVRVEIGCCRIIKKNK